MAKKRDFGGYSRGGPVPPEKALKTPFFRGSGAPFWVLPKMTFFRLFEDYDLSIENFINDDDVDDEDSVITSKNAVFSVSADHENGRFGIGGSRFQTSNFVS